jgi:exosortase H (IPTLxxWG-CTERM-specific)
LESTSFWDHVKHNRPIIQFICITLFSLTLFFLILDLETIQTGFVAPYTRVVAACSRLLLRIIGVEARGDGSLIISPQFSVSILNVCNGLEATAIFFATVLAFPTSLKSKLIGIAIGYPLIFFINLIRIITLFVIGFKLPNIFETAHYYYAQAFVILATIAIWLFWVSKYSSYGPKRHHQAAD